MQQRAATADSVKHAVSSRTIRRSAYIYWAYPTTALPRLCLRAPTNAGNVLEERLFLSRCRRLSTRTSWDPLQGSTADVWAEMDESWNWVLHEQDNVGRWAGFVDSTSHRFAVAFIPANRTCLSCHLCFWYQELEHKSRATFPMISISDTRASLPLLTHFHARIGGSRSAWLTNVCMHFVIDTQ